MEDQNSKCAMVFDDLALMHGGMLAANGHSLYKSRDVIMDCLDMIRMNSEKSCQLMIYYTDLPENDFNRVFRVVNAGLNLGPDVLCAAVGRSMYEKCFPDSSTDLIFSSIAALFMSKSPCRIQDGIFPTSPYEMEIFDRQAASDWKTFLLMRGRELRPGGYLVVLNIGKTRQGDVTIDIKGGLNTLSNVLRSLLEDGLIAKDEFLDCNFPASLHRTEEDHALPFYDKDLIETGLELVSMRSFLNKLDHPSFGVLSKDDATKMLYADRIVAGIKPWLYGTIYTGLSHSRSQQERECLVETYFSRLWDFAYKNDDQPHQIALVEVVAKKRI